MGHYASEMGYERREDRWNYHLVNALGFESVYTAMSSTSVLRCPECFCLVEGEYAEEHWNRLHGLQSD